MARPTMPVVYENVIKVMKSDMTFEQGHIQPNLEPCPICGKNIMRIDRFPVLINGKHWHIHKMCRKKQYMLAVKEKK
jgi:hypothetical protein